MTVKIRTDISVKDVYQRAKQEDCATIRARLLGIAAVLEKKPRGYAAKLAGITINNIRTWIQRFNTHGFDGLINKKQPGQEQKWKKEIEQYLKDKVLTGASFEKDERVVFRLQDFQNDLEEKFGLRFGLSTIWYKLKELNLSWLSARQLHPKSDFAIQETFKKKCLSSSKKYKRSIQLKR
jgi:transposase